MGRIRVLAVVLALGSIMLSPVPAHAGSVWDANDPAHRLDIRWVGVYQQADGRIARDRLLLRPSPQQMVQQTPLPFDWDPGYDGEPAGRLQR
jgi:hypothetical protein